MLYFFVARSLHQLHKVWLEQVRQYFARRLASICYLSKYELNIKYSRIRVRTAHWCAVVATSRANVSLFICRVCYYFVGEMFFSCHLLRLSVGLCRLCLCVAEEVNTKSRSNDHIIFKFVSLFIFSPLVFHPHILFKHFWVSNSHLSKYQTRCTRHRGRHSSCLLSTKEHAKYLYGNITVILFSSCHCALCTHSLIPIVAIPFIIKLFRRECVVQLVQFV